MHLNLKWTHLNSKWSSDGIRRIWGMDTVFTWWTSVKIVASIGCFYRASMWSLLMLHSFGGLYYAKGWFERQPWGRRHEVLILVAREYAKTLQVNEQHPQLLLKSPKIRTSYAQSAAYSVDSNWCCWLNHLSERE